MQHIFNIAKLENSICIDANWDKPQWQKADKIEVNNYMGQVPVFRPHTEARMLYDDDNIYVIFKVRDKYVICKNNQVNDPVWEDSCVEFFFSPDTDFPERYFNLEVNCGGTALMQYNITPRDHVMKVDPVDIAGIDIAHSLPEIIVPEITDEITWTIECKIPVNMLGKYSKITLPEREITWKANFYKIAVNTSNPHYITWTPVTNEKPDFHLPGYFGSIKFM